MSRWVEPIKPAICIVACVVAGGPHSPHPRTVLLLLLFVLATAGVPKRAYLRGVLVRIVRGRVLKDRWCEHDFVSGVMNKGKKFPQIENADGQHVTNSCA